MKKSFLKIWLKYILNYISNFLFITTHMWLLTLCISLQELEIYIQHLRKKTQNWLSRFCCFASVIDNESRICFQPTHLDFSLISHDTQTGLGRVSAHLLSKDTPPFI